MATSSANSHSCAVTPTHSLMTSGRGGGGGGGAWSRPRPSGRGGDRDRRRILHESGLGTQKSGGTGWGSRFKPGV